MGLPLLASLAVVLTVPRVGLPVHTALLVWAMVSDQCRMQPHVISLAWLMWGTCGLPGGTIAARASLTATWLYAGIHKLCSPAYFTRSGPWMLHAIWPGAAPNLAAPLAAAVALTEVALGIGVLFPAWRRAVAVGAVIFHTAILLVLGWRLDWNREVWPWNAALALAGPLLVGCWQGPGLGAEWHRASRFARGLAVALLLLPAGYWLGVVDAYLAHCVYSDNTPRAYACTPLTRRSLDEDSRRHGIVLPPAHRLFPAFFRSVGRPGEWLEIEDPRWIARVRGRAFRKLAWDDLDAPANQPAKPRP
jgi:uncharacterized membrane protein YphA (DoxX/SURF4 family)